VCGSAALYEPAPRIDLVGAVDGDVEPTERVDAAEGLHA
jgi:hypothetical protein